MNNAAELRIILDNAAWHMSNDSWKLWAKEALELLESEPALEPGEFTERKWRLSSVAVLNMTKGAVVDRHNKAVEEACDIIDRQAAEIKAIDAHIQMLMDSDELIRLGADRDGKRDLSQRVMRILGGYLELQSAIEAKDKRLELLEKILEEIQNWANAYPVEVFPRLTKDNFKQAAEVLKANGLSLDRISADNMRHVLDGIKAKVEQALQTGDSE